MIEVKLYYSGFFGVMVDSNVVVEKVVFYLIVWCVFVWSGRSKYDIYGGFYLY